MTRRRLRTGKSQETGYRRLRSGNRFGHAADRCSSSASGRRRSADAGRGVPVGVLFEISIVCHVLCSWFWWVAGVSPVLGVVLVVRLVFWFSGSGLSVCLVPRGSSARLCGGAGGGLRVVPGLGVDVVRPALRFCAGFSVPVRGGGLGVLGPAFSCLVRGGWVAPGSSSALLGGGGLGVFFSARRSLVLRFRCWSSWSCRGWGFGGCRVGLGFFLRLLLFGPGLFGLGLFGFCLESLILAQDERWRRA